MSCTGRWWAWKRGYSAFALVPWQPCMAFELFPVATEEKPSTREVKRLCTAWFLFEWTLSAICSIGYFLNWCLIKKNIFLNFANFLCLELCIHALLRICLSLKRCKSKVFNLINWIQWNSSWINSQSMYCFSYFPWIHCSTVSSSLKLVNYPVWNL